MENSNFKILVVDDIPKNLELVSTFLYTEDYTVIQCSSGFKAFEILKQKKIDLILLDVTMPDMDGYQVCERIKLDKKNQDIPVIFLTARSETEDIVKGFEVGGADYLTKPLNPKELLIRVSSHLKAKVQKDLIKKQNEELLNINEKIKTLATQLKVKNKDLLASIHYAKFIQRATLPNETYISQFLPENFIFYKPKDIVSGDFYWIKQVQNQILIAVADCTGHGVPGALLSMLGITYLNEIVLNYPKTSQIKASDILDRLRIRVEETLNLDNQKLTRDGMDIALCVIDVNTKIMQYSGAHNPIYIVRYETGKKELFRYKADRMPVGAHLKEKPFTNHPIQLHDNDLIYMFSDGFSDQLGGAHGNKYFTSHFRELLLDISDKPMQEQKEILFLEHEDWKGYYKQIDDILVLGFKISQTYGDDIELF